MWSECSVTCGRGVREQTRRCTVRGACAGEDTQEESCIQRGVSGIVGICFELSKLTDSDCWRTNARFAIAAGTFCNRATFTAQVFWRSRIRAAFKLSRDLSLLKHSSSNNQKGKFFRKSQIKNFAKQLLKTLFSSWTLSN